MFKYDAKTDTLTITITGVSKIEGTPSASGKSMNLAVVGERFSDAAGRTPRFQGTLFVKK